MSDDKELVAEYRFENASSINDLEWFERPVRTEFGVSDGEGMNLFMDEKTDFWQKTFYQPILINDNGHLLFKRVTEENFMVEAPIDLNAIQQFDQAGLMVRIDDQHWIKTGLEYVDGKYKLSCVTTNNYSDWSSTVYPSGKLAIRIWRQGEDFVIESKDPQSDEWDFFRICHLNTIGPTDEIMMGLYACAPSAADGHCLFERMSYYKVGRYPHDS